MREKMWWRKRWRLWLVPEKDPCVCYLWWELREQKRVHVPARSSLGKQHSPCSSGKVTKKGLCGASRLMGLNSLTAREQMSVLCTKMGFRNSWGGVGPRETVVGNEGRHSDHLPWIDDKHETEPCIAVGMPLRTDIPYPSFTSIEVTPRTWHKPVRRNDYIPEVFMGLILLFVVSFGFGAQCLSVFCGFSLKLSFIFGLFSSGIFFEDYIKCEFLIVRFACIFF